MVIGTDVLIEYLVDDLPVLDAKLVVDQGIGVPVPRNPVAVVGALTQFRTAKLRIDVCRARHVPAQIDRDPQVVDFSVGVIDTEIDALFGQLVHGLRPCHGTRKSYRKQG